jgi:hypothetical protein
VEITKSGSESAPVWASDGLRVRRGQSFLRFVMPVGFPDNGRGYRFEERCDALGASARWTLLKGESQSFLPHVRMHFNTVVLKDHGLAAAKLPGDAAPLNPAAAFGYIFKCTDLDRFPLPVADFLVHVPGKPHPIEMEITGAQLGIFRMGVGFVSLEVTPRSEALPDWLDTLHFLRFYRARGKSLHPVGPPGSGEPGRLRLENLLGPLLAAATLDGETYPFPTSPGGTGRVGRVRELYVPGELLTYASLFVDGVPDAEQRHLLYHVLNRFRSTTESSPGENYDLERWCLPYQQGQQFLNSIQGSAFVAFDATPSAFNMQSLPAHLRSTYYVLFMLALLQRFALDQLSEAVAWSTGRVLGDSERSRARRELERVTALDGRLLDFTGRCYFVQVSQTEHHHRYYARLREVNQIEDRYREVTDEVHALRAHASSRVRVEEERTSLRVATALMVITCVLLPLQVIEALFSAKLPELPGIRGLSPTWSAVTAGLVLLFAMGIAALIIHGSRWRPSRWGRLTGRNAAGKSVEGMPGAGMPRRH